MPRSVEPGQEAFQTIGRNQAAAAEPVNRRYQVALDQLLRRATQLNDLETAIKIREELKTLGTVSAVTGNLKARLTNSTWDWWQGQRLTFLANGKAKWSYDGSESFTWAVTSNESRTIEGLTSRGYKYKVTFDPTLTTGTILGDEGKTREMKIIPPQ